MHRVTFSARADAMCHAQRTQTRCTAARSGARLPWWKAQDSPEVFRAEIAVAQKRLEDQPYMAVFYKHSLLDCVVVANKLEGTLPADYEDPATYQLLEQQADASLDLATEFAVPAVLWAAEGSGDKSQARQQLLQFTKAAQYLISTLPGPLTNETVCTAHNLMMWGAIEEDGSMHAAGQYRSTPAHSGTGYVYPEPDSVPGLLSRVVDSYNSSCEQGTDSCSLAAQLLYQTVTVHPFENGNGRLCRLLAAYAAMAAGEPFMLNLSNGRSKARQHYQQMLQYTDKHHDLGRLECFVLECVHLHWQNAVAYAGLS